LHLPSAIRHRASALGIESGCGDPMMRLFEQNDPDQEVVSSSDVGTRALSVVAVENHFVEAVYDKLASVYDLIFGPILHPGRVQAIKRMAIERGERVLEVGVGTGLNATLYPSDCIVIGVDLSPRMLEKARQRLTRKNIWNARLLEMDAAALTFEDESFDIVYAPYLISVVPDPIAVIREMHRVCRAGGHIIILNHFRSSNPVLSRIERLISPLTIHFGFKSDLDLPALLAQAGLRPVSVEKVNVPRIWSLITCVKQ
jgi:phosphatidylethanolamine/phosphatidyl-N-methylethanolamine N-methyltransferase